MTVTVLHGDSLVVLPTLPDASVDAVVTDPPYELGFMGKRWDSTGIAYRVDMWAECLRVLKPGGWLLAFGGTRTSHRLACAIEDAGFEIRDSIAWLYGSGFPKSMDVSKAIDRAQSAEGAYGEPKSAAHAGWIDRGAMRGAEGHEGYQRPWMQDEQAVDRAARQYVPATDDARTWQGWGTALKPAHEPIVVARKPLAGTVSANVLAHGTGALNIDGCRVEADWDTDPTRRGWQGRKAPDKGMFSDGTNVRAEHSQPNDAGRWPANVCLSEDQADALDRQSGTLTSGTKNGAPKKRDDETDWRFQSGTREGDTGGASRFFYVAKASSRERPKVDGLAHPTVKPLNLMRWLVRLVTPPGGLVLDPFAGSGTTAEACLLEGFDCIAIEREADYLPLIAARLARHPDRLDVAI